MRQPEIRLLDFSDTCGCATSLVPILTQTAAVRQVACTISEAGAIDGLAKNGNSRSKANELFVIVLPSSLQPHAISVLQNLKQEFPRAQTIIVLEVEEPDCVMDLIHSGVDELLTVYWSGRTRKKRWLKQSGRASD
jgi:hypothetical protein